jgi:hypothetical protein
MPRTRLAVALATALVVLCPAPSRAENAIRPDLAPDWRRADTVAALVETLETWLDMRTDWPRRDEIPSVLLVSEWQVGARRAAGASFQRGRLRGLHDPARSEILLVRPWDRRDAGDVSVLLHELAHHRQAPRHWYCPAAQELPAYRLQEAWLAESGLSADIDWMAVVLETGCTPRDIHPD